MKHYTNTSNPVDKKSEYEAVPLEQAEKFWADRNKALRARSEVLVIALVGKDLAQQWWSSANLAFEGQTPSEQFDRNAERVYSYLMRAAEGGW